jgi:hypothetical protein
METEKTPASNTRVMRAGNPPNSERNRDATLGTPAGVTWGGDGQSTT